MWSTLELAATYRNPTAEQKLTKADFSGLVRRSSNFYPWAPLVAVVLTGLCTCLLVAMARRLAPSAEQCWRIGRRASVERMPPARPVARRQV